MNARRSNAAFSLVEVMVAILILAIALTGLVHGISTALASNKESELQTVAVFFAQGKIEELRATDLIEDGDTEGDCGKLLPIYRWRQSVSATDIPGLHEVNVVVEHTQTKREIYELKTMLFQPADDSTPGKGDGKDSKSKKRRGGQT
jgi:prepilin-type N-terminal cleavage/methylation domain-containing protein